MKVLKKMNENRDIPKKVVIILMIALVTVTIVSWITLTTYANTLHSNSIRVESVSNQAVGHVGVTIVNSTPTPQKVTNNQANVGINIT